MKNLFILLLCLFFLSSNSQNYFKKFKDLEQQRVSIVGDDYTVEVEIIKPENERKIKTKDLRNYAWFVNNQIQNTQGGYDSRLLHGSYVSKYNSKALKEKGIYRYGLKKGVWKQWYENGAIKSITKWHKGLQSGRFIQYESDNQIAKIGKYSKGKLNGKLVEYKDGEKSTITKYKNGIKQVPKIKVEKVKPTKEKNEKIKKDTKLNVFFGKVKEFFTIKKKENKTPKTKNKAVASKANEKNNK